MPVAFDASTPLWSSCQAGYVYLCFCVPVAPIAGSRREQNEAHHQWRQVAEKLDLLERDPEQYFELHGQPSVPV
jgi:hypothetical protein